MSMVEKIYRITDENTAQKLSDLLLEIPQEHVRIANLIIDYAKQTLPCLSNQRSTLRSLLSGFWHTLFQKNSLL